MVENLPHGRVVLHVDLDYFFAQCEERENPSLKDKAVVVCVFSGRTEDSGAVSTANYVARKYGVKSGMPITLAKKILKDKDAVFLPVNFELYESVSRNIMQILRKYADSFEQTGIDEAFLDVSQRVNGDFETARELAEAIKREILEKEKLTCSMGVAPNKLVAKIASDFRKPNGLTVVKPQEVQSFLFPLSVGKLFGVGRKTEKAMEKLGIKTIGDLAKYDVERLVDFFGRTLGIYFHQAAHGIDESPVQERGPAESTSRIVTLKKNTRDLNLILEQIHPLCEDIHSRLLKQGLNFKSISAMAVMQDLSVRSKTKTFENPLSELEILKETVKELFEKLLEKEPKLEVRRAGVKISGFVEAQKKQTKITDFKQ
jgi:DNA polymerase IV (DinB-like DNA polymerase)